MGGTAVAVTMTSIRLDTDLADEAVEILGAKSRTEAVHVALREIVALKRFQNLMRKHGGKLSFKGIGEKARHLRHVGVHRPSQNRPTSTANRWSAWSYSDLFRGACGTVRGATRPTERDFLRALEKNHPVLTPTARNWLDSGQLLGKMFVDRGLTAEKLRDLHFDVLIALTARSHGALLVTSNRADFEMISQYRKIELEIW